MSDATVADIQAASRTPRAASPAPTQYDPDFFTPINDAAKAYVTNLNADSDIQREQDQAASGYSVPNYSPQVASSPVDRNWQANHPGADPTIPNATPPQVQQAMDADNASQPPQDDRREVGAGEGAWRGANEVGAGILGTLSGAAAFIGYPLTAADDFLSGRKVKSLTDTIVNAEHPLDAEQQAYAINPNKEKLTLGGQIGYGAGQAGLQLPIMMASAPAEAAATAVDAAASLAEKIATHILKTAQVSSLPAASQARNAAQQTIEDGGTPTDAMNAAVQSYAQTVAFNTLPLGAKGGVATRVASGGAMGAAQAAASGGDSQQIISGSILGAATAGLMGERSEPVSASDRAASRVRDLAQQIAGTTPEESDALAAGADLAQSAAANNPELQRAQQAAQSTTQEQPAAGEVSPAPGVGDIAATNPGASGNEPSAAPSVMSEPIRNGRAVLYRGDVDEMRQVLADAGMPLGMRYTENGRDTGLYFPASMKYQVDSVLASAP